MHQLYMACPDICQQIASQFPRSARTELIERSHHEYFGAEQMQETTYMSWSIGLCVKRRQCFPKMEMLQATLI